MTNPDNVGGLPELPPPWSLVGMDEDFPVFSAAQMRAYGELCRAAPAGGAPICPECKAPGLLFECVACSHSNYPKDSAPAGGDVPTVLDALHYLRAAICETEAPECYWDITEAVDKWIADANVGKLTPKRDSAPAGSGEVDPRPNRVEYSIFQLEQMAMAGPLAFDALAIREAAALLRKLQQGAVDVDYKLPCDVRVAPATTINKGCKLGTLIECIKLREEWGSNDADK
jgi:hypothetical protein